ncbi:MAG: glycosyltransferase family 2 protein [Microgenomates group bacterium]
MMLSSLSICIPAYRDEQTIRHIVLRAKETAKKYAKKFEILVINDASPDGLTSVLATLSSRIPELRVITHQVNQGYGKTIKELYYGGRYDWLFTLPGDGQFEPLELVKMLPYTTRYDMVIGLRKHRHDSDKRKQQSAFYNALLRLFFSLSTRDVNSIRLMRRRMLKNIQLTSSSAFVDAELAIDALQHGYRIVEVPIRHEKRKTTGASGGKLSVILPVIWDMLRYRI